MEWIGKANLGDYITKMLSSTTENNFMAPLYCKHLDPFVFESNRVLVFCCTYTYNQIVLLMIYMHNPLGYAALLDQTIKAIEISLIKKVKSESHKHRLEGD